MNLNPQLAKRLEKISGLPSPPKVAMSIIHAANDPNTSLAQVAGVITADPVITAKVMRTANSALYARPGGCSTLRQALVLLGLDATLIIALSFSLALGLRRDRSSATLDLELFWRRSLLSATAAKAVGRALGRSDTEALFLGGLLQDIGMLALDKLDTGLYASLGDRQREHRRVAEFEQQHLGASHADVGAWLMQRWQLPDSLVTAIAQSHNPTAPGDDGFARCIAMSGPLADVWLSSDWSYSFRELVALAVESLKLNHIQIGIVLDELRDQIPETEALFEKDLIDPAQGFTAMEEARELLQERGVEGFLQEPTAAATTMLPAAPVTMLRLQHRIELLDVLEKEFSTALENDRCAGVIVAGINGLDGVRSVEGPATAERLLREAALVLLDNTGARVVGQLTYNQLVVWLEDANHLVTSMAARRTLKAFEQAICDLTGSVEAEIAIDLGIAALDPAHPRATVNELVDAAQAALGEARFGTSPLVADAPVAGFSD